ARVPVWTVLDDVEWFQVFRGPTRTATAVAAAVNALAAVADSTTPVTATVVGSGSGTITQATWDELDDEHAFIRLRDGLNWVQTTVLPPGPSDETEFVLKRDPSSDLLANSDWENEDPILAPVLAVDVATWLRTPAVTGLFTVSDVVASANGHAVQITSNTLGSESSVEIQDGTGNAATAAVIGPGQLGASNQTLNGSLRTRSSIVTVPRGEAEGFTGGQWVNLDNTTGGARDAWWISAASVSSIDGGGVWTFTGTSLYTVVGEWDGARIQVDTWDDLVAIRWSKSANFEYPSLILNEGLEGGFLYLTFPTVNHSGFATIAAANQGVFQVLRATESAYEVTVWVRNPHAVAGVGVAKVKSLGPGSTVPSDVWSVATSKFGAGNQGNWAISEMGADASGEQFVTNTLRVDTSDKPAQIMVSPVAMGADAGLLQVVAGVPYRAIKQLLTVTPNQTDGRYADMQLDTSWGYEHLSETLGTVVSARDKLAFPDGVSTGVDGYRYSTGLVGEVNRVVYGDPADEVTYPGYAAAGARVLVSGPIVRRVQLALQVRVRSGSADQDLADRVRSAAASAVNRVGVGTGGIAISDVVASVSEVPGVIAVSVVAPSYGPVHDRIELGPGEKPLVLNLRNDVRVSFVEA
ncbi:MAG: hypothetical protein PHS14_18065, partial [Elusimicrobia bacterium]|nr:hypothetical protein [Elusimicrobiota bacterium]